MEKATPSFALYSLRRPGHPQLVCLAIVTVFLCLQFLYLPVQLFEPNQSQIALHEHRLEIFESGLQQCLLDKAPSVLYDVPPSPQRANPRWNTKGDHKDTTMILNATLFDGTTFLDEPVNILVRKGVILGVTSAPNVLEEFPGDALMVDAKGRYVTPGLVDMHSHHISSTWPGEFSATSDENEINDETGPLTPMVRVLESLKAYDIATTLIASGGVTTSLILPGSANIMGGEAYPVKNVLRSGANGEEIVEDLLLEHGIPQAERRRYMKMACGENPKGLYDHTRMGLAWKLREQMAKGKDLMAKQDEWCLSAAAAKEAGSMAAINALVQSSKSERGGYPRQLALDSTVAMLRGQVNVNIHCYEPEDLENMLRHNEEFDFSIAAFHHAIEAWKIPELIKAKGRNITIATFQDFAFYKQEAYDANLYAGKILAEHGVPVAYKSDHVQEETNARYLLFQAAGAHAFGLPLDLAMQAVTSVPARSIGQDHRIGFVKPGYDADLVIFDAHPLSVGATPIQVFIDGKPTLPFDGKDEQLLISAADRSQGISPQMRPILEPKEREKFCANIYSAHGRLVFTGISKSFVGDERLDLFEDAMSRTNNMTMIVKSGQVICIGDSENCIYDTALDTVIELKNGYVLPGLTAVTGTMGLLEIAAEDATGDGAFIASKDVLNPSNVVYAKYGVHLEGKGFRRARIGGVTRAITSPVAYGSVHGVSAGIRTSGNKTVLDGGIFQEEVALHFLVGQEAKVNSKSISDAIAKLRRILIENDSKDNIYGQAARGSIPVVVHAVNQYDIAQIIKIKQECSKVNIIIMGGHEAYAVAKELAKAEIPLIFTAHRGAPDRFEKKETLAGPPLTRSPTSVLVEHNVTFALAIAGDGVPIGESSIHNLLLEAAWAAKYAGLSQRETIQLVSKNVEDILGLERTKDIVIYEGNPLEFGATVVLTLDGQGSIGECWPEAT